MRWKRKGEFPRPSIPQLAGTIIASPKQSDIAVRRENQRQIQQQQRVTICTHGKFNERIRLRQIEKK
jgi:hypothetical protein